MNSNLKSFLSLATLVLALLSFSAHAGTTSYFIYDESGHVIGEYDANGNPIQEHVYLGDRPVAVVQGGSASGGTVDYVTTDQLNTPRVITDSSQAVLWSWNSDPFGNGNPTGSLTYDLRFPGQQYDSETGHNYNYNRDYSPSIGRYIESDPLGVETEINTYTYAGGNPTIYDDPFGLYTVPHGVPAPSAAISAMLTCMEKLLNTQFTIASTTNGQHQDPGHANGTSVDVVPQSWSDSHGFFCAAGAILGTYAYFGGSKGITAQIGSAVQTAEKAFQAQQSQTCGAN